MKTTLIRITIATAAITVLGLSACSAGAETKPAGNTQAVSTSQAGATNTPSAGNVATTSNGNDTNATASAGGSDNKSSTGNNNDGKNKGDSDDKPCVGNPNVSSSNGVVTLSGHCDTIKITGSGNTVASQGIAKKNDTGSDNSLS